MTVPTKQLRAKSTLVDGRQALEIENTYAFDLDEASTALAIVYAEQPRWDSADKLRVGLRTAADQDLLNQPYSVETRAIEAYRQRLTSQPQIMFPEPELRAQMLAQLRGAQDEWRGADPETRGTSATHYAQIKLPALWSKHDRKDEDGVPLDPVVPEVHIEIPRWYHLDRAALALAIVHRSDLVPRSKQHQVPRADYIIRDQLRLAGEQGVLKLKRLIDKADPGLVGEYRAMLLDTGVFDRPTT